MVLIGLRATETSGMMLLHPGILLVAAGLATVPVVIHLLSRRRHQQEPWAAMELLYAAHERSRRRLRLEQWVLLGLRCLILLLMGLVLARPAFEASARSAWLGRPRCDHVIVLDNSLSMQARRDGGGSSFDAARSQAIRIIESLDDADGVAVVTASTQGRAWSEQPVRDHGAMVRLLESLACSSGMDDLPRAMRECGEILLRSDAAPGGARVHVLSDFTRAALAAPADSASSPAIAADIQLLDTSGAARENLSIRSLTCSGQMIAADWPVRFEVEVQNHGTERAEGVDIEIMADGRSLKKLALDRIEPHARRRLEFELSLPRAAWYRLEARLVEPPRDVLPADDVRRLAVEVQKDRSLLLVEGQEERPRPEQQLFYMAVALGGAAESGSQRFRITQIGPMEIPQAVLDAHEALVLGNVTRLPAMMWRRIEDYVRGGGGLVLVLGSRVDATNYEKDAEDLLPVRLGQWQAAAATGETPLLLNMVDGQHPILADFHAHARGGLLQSRIFGHWTTEPGEWAHGARALLAFSDGAPALLVHALGEGRIATLLTGVDMASSNLPARPDFVPLMVNLAAFAASAEASRFNLTCGEAITVPPALCAANSPVEVIRPDGHAAAPEPGEPLVYRDTAAPGFYAMKTGSREAVWAVNPGIAESDLARADDAALRAAFGPGAKRVSQEQSAVVSRQNGHPREATMALGVLLLACVAVESVLALWFGRIG